MLDQPIAEYLPLEHPWEWALAICAMAAALEGVMSGTRVKLRFAELRLPQPALPLWAWSIIGVAYYVLFFFMLISFLGSPSTPTWTLMGLALVAALLVANAVWNCVFFRKKDLWLSFVFFVPYDFLAVALAFVLFRLDSPLKAWYLLYVGYLAYATWWGRSIWRINRSS